jgi:hypothetical protein
VRREGSVFEDENMRLDHLEQLISPELPEAPPSFELAALPSSESLHENSCGSGGASSLDDAQGAGMRRAPRKGSVLSNMPDNLRRQSSVAMLHRAASAMLAPGAEEQIERVVDALALRYSSDVLTIAARRAEELESGATAASLSTLLSRRFTEAAQAGDDTIDRAIAAAGTGTATATATATGKAALGACTAETRRDEERAMTAAANAVTAAAAALSAEGQSPQGVPMVVPRTYGTPPSGASATSPGTPTPASASSSTTGIPRRPDWATVRAHVGTRQVARILSAPPSSGSPASVVFSSSSSGANAGAQQGFIPPAAVQRLKHRSSTIQRQTPARSGGEGGSGSGSGSGGTASCSRASCQRSALATPTSAAAGTVATIGGGGTAAVGRARSSRSAASASSHHASSTPYDVTVKVIPGVSDGAVDDALVDAMRI